MDSIKVKPELLEFVNNEVLPELGFEESFFGMLQRILF